MSNVIDIVYNTYIHDYVNILYAFMFTYMYHSQSMAKALHHPVSHAYTMCCVQVHVMVDTYMYMYMYCAIL